MSIRVRALKVCYHNHKRWKPGEIFEIKNMQVFSEKSMVRVDQDAVDKSPDEHEASQSALSEGTKKALHDGKVTDPKLMGAQTDKLNAKKDNENKPELKFGDEGYVLKEGDEGYVAPAADGQQTTGDEDVI